jgi:hypothetical protein
MADGAYIHTKSILEEGQIYFSPYEQLNDPFEYSYVWTIDHLHKDKVQFWSKQNDFYRDALASVGEEAQARSIAEWENSMSAPRGHKIIGGDQIGVFCTCEDWHNLVLWSHYGDNHRGLCFVFESEEDEYLKKIHRVQYTTQPGNYNLYRGIDYQDLLTRKFSDWSYEREVRVFYNPGVYKFQRPALKKIIFGASAWLGGADENWRRLNQLIEIARQKFPGIAIQRALRGSNSYNLRLDTI